MPSTNLAPTRPLRFVEVKNWPKERLQDALSDVTFERTGFRPKPFQLDAAETTCRQRDLALFAGTGFGKTVTMVMPCFLSTKIVAFIVSPLNVLEADQVRTLRIGLFINEVCSLLQRHKNSEAGTLRLQL